MNLERFSLVFSSILCYGLPAFFTDDYLYRYYGLFLAFFSGLYHYYDEKFFFAEDFMCSFFFKLHFTTNYIWWLSWEKMAYYAFFSELIGYIIFYGSFTSWRIKHRNYAYMIIHNIWHLFTGYLPYVVVRDEQRVDIGYWDDIFMVMFVVFMVNYNLKQKLLVKGVVLGTVYLWNLSNIYNIFFMIGFYGFYKVVGRIRFG